MFTNFRIAIFPVLVAVLYCSALIGCAKRAESTPEDQALETRDRTSVIDQQELKVANDQEAAGDSPNGAATSMRLPPATQAVPSASEAVAMSLQASDMAPPSGGSAPRAAMARTPIPVEMHSAAMTETAAASSAPSVAIDTPFKTLPAGATRNDQDGFATIQVFYATDRQRGALPLSAYEVTGQKQTLYGLGIATIVCLALALLFWARGRVGVGSVATLAGCVCGGVALAFVSFGSANIEKHGVTYSTDRGTLTRGVCSVTVPDTHRRGKVERPSLLRFEFRENQQKHIVLTQATELSADAFHQRLANTIDVSPDRDLLVFIHGYNVDFPSAVQRTAQIAVDLPFEGVPVCYSWPSQATLVGYPVDQNNADWTVPHLKQFLTELARESGADSINVVAHSMGNRAMTAAMQQMQWETKSSEKVFDRVVLAAPDVDADRFRNEFAPALQAMASQVTLYASSDDQALIASRTVHGHPRAGDSGRDLVIVPGIETIDVSGIDLSLLGHSYYGDNESMLRDLYDVLRAGLPATERASLITRGQSPLIYWQLAQQPGTLMPGDRLR